MALVVLAAWPVHAKTRERGIPVQTYQPALDSLGFLSLDNPLVIAPQSLDILFGVNFALRPMRLEFYPDVTDNHAAALRYSNAFDFQATLGLTRWMQLSLTMPFYRLGPGSAFNINNEWGFTHNDPLTTMKRNIPSSVPGDPSVAMKFRLLQLGRFSTGASLGVFLPFGVEEVFAGDQDITAKGTLLFGWQDTRLTVLLNAGYLWRKDYAIYSPTDENTPLLSAGPEVHAGLGVRFQVFRNWAIMGAFNKFVPLSGDKHTDSPAEALAGVAWSPKQDLTLTIFGGTGTGFIEDYGRGTPLRIGAQLTWTAEHRVVVREIHDRDGDGIPDDEDQCPDEPGVPELGGCPDPDRDMDGVCDPWVSEKGQAEKYQHVCTGIDKCPTQSGDPRYDGCPIPDRDGDGIPDDLDKCPDVPGVARYHGCPIPDRDGDGIPDEDDLCPDEPGVPEFGGCPDTGVQLNIVDGKIIPSGKIEFQRRTSTLTQASEVVLLELANDLKASPQIRLVRIEVHLESGGREPQNIQLTNARANAIRNFLVSKGVSPVRVQGVGYGSKYPIKPNTTPENRAANNRVDFILVHQ